MRASSARYSTSKFFELMVIVVTNRASAGVSQPREGPVDFISRAALRLRYSEVIEHLDRQKDNDGNQD